MNQSNQFKQPTIGKFYKPARNCAVAPPWSETKWENRENVQTPGMLIQMVSNPKLEDYYTFGLLHTTKDGKSFVVDLKGLSIKSFFLIYQEVPQTYDHKLIIHFSPLINLENTWSHLEAQENVFCLLESWLEKERVRWNITEYNLSIDPIDELLNSFHLEVSGTTLEKIQYRLTHWAKANNLIIVEIQINETQ